MSPATARPSLYCRRVQNPTDSTPQECQPGSPRAGENSILVMIIIALTVPKVGCLIVCAIGEEMPNLLIPDPDKMQAESTYVRISVGVVRNKEKITSALRVLTP